MKHCEIFFQNTYVIYNYYKKCVQEAYKNCDKNTKNYLYYVIFNILFSCTFVSKKSDIKSPRSNFVFL